MKILKGIFLTLFLLGLACAAYIFWEGFNFLESAPQADGKEIYFDVEQGVNFTQTANLLKKNDIITNAKYFILLARFKKLDADLQVGRFVLNTGWKPEKILDTLINGKPLLYRVTFPEGLAWWQVARILEKEGLVNFNDFEKVVFDPAFLNKYGIPFASAEGFLMPNTYLFKKSDKPNYNDALAIAGRMVDTFWRDTKNLWPDKKPPDAEFLFKTIILASIVEKETSIGKERAKVAGVYKNRLRINMLLQADPTIIYGLGQKFSGNLKRSHLRDAKNIYNTYRHGGLPPGPICSPGVEAIRAALMPEKHKYYYFVAERDGGNHIFSTNLKAHNRAVRSYLRNRSKGK